MELAYQAVDTARVLFEDLVGEGIDEVRVGRERGREGGKEGRRERRKEREGRKGRTGGREGRK